MPPSNLARLRKFCLSLPDATEVGAWGAPTFRVGKIFAMYSAPGNNHGDGREAVWVKTGFINQDLLISSMPSSYFMPAYVGPYGWTGVYLDAKTDWESLAELLKDSYRMVASRKRIALLDATPAPKAPPKKRAATRGKAKPSLRRKPARRRLKPMARSKR